jgi:hypothetical protein
MGSGISLSKDQIIYFIKRDLVDNFNENQNIRPRYTDDGYEIFYDYTDEVKLKKIIKEINTFSNKK